MEDEKMIRAMVAGHVYAAMLTQEHEARPRDELVTYSDIAREAVLATDALLVELKKDSPAPAPESAPPLADEARVPGDVPKRPAHPCEAIGCDAPSDRFFYCGPKEDPWSEEAHFCSLHAAVRPPSILLEWHRAAAKKARAA